MQIDKTERDRFGAERWRPRFVDYLFVAFTTSSTFGPTDAAVLARWAKVLTMCQIFIFAQHRGLIYIPRARNFVGPRICNAFLVERLVLKALPTKYAVLRQIFASSAIVVSQRLRRSRSTRGANYTGCRVSFGCTAKSGPISQLKSKCRQRLPGSPSKYPD